MWGALLKGIGSLFMSGATDKVSGGEDSSGGGGDKKEGGFMGAIGNIGKMISVGQKAKSAFAPGEVAPTQDVSAGGGAGGPGYDVDSYKAPVQEPAEVPPQYKNGGTPNGGKPAGIYDLRSGEVTGTMNEAGPEKIVPFGGKVVQGYSGDGSVSLIDTFPDVAKSMTNLGDKPTPSGMIANQMAEQSQPSGSISPQAAKVQGMGAQAPSQGQAQLYGGAGVTEDQRDQTVAGSFAPFELSMTGDNSKLDKSSTDSRKFSLTEKGSGAGEDKAQEGLGLKKEDWGKLVYGMARATGFYYDMRRSRLGLPKSALTSTLDWFEKGKAATDANANNAANRSSKERVANIKYKGDKAADYRKLEIETRKDALSDWESGKNVDSKRYIKEAKGDEALAQRNYVNDKVNFALDDEEAEYKDTGKKEKYGGFVGIGRKERNERKRTGDYVPTKNNGSSGSSAGYDAWLSKQPKGKYKTKDEARKAFKDSGGK